METKHTPAPWGLCFHLQSHENDASCPCGYRGSIWGADSEHVVCEMGSAVTVGQEGLEPARYSRDVELANARLIAAAPELLDALTLLERVYETGDFESEFKPALARARAAINKATGAA